MSDDYAARQVDSAKELSLLGALMAFRTMFALPDALNRRYKIGAPLATAVFLAVLILARLAPCFGQADPASEPAVLAVAKVLPAVVNINTERIVRRTVRDPFEDFYSQFFGSNRFRPREVRQTLQSLGSGFMIDPAGHIVTNQHLVGRAAH